MQNNEASANLDIKSQDSTANDTVSLRVYEANGSSTHNKYQDGFTWKELFPEKILTILALSFLFIMSLPFILTRSACSRLTDFSNSGQIGDTIGGTTAPIIGLLSTVLLYVTIRLQWISLKEAQRQWKIDNEEIERRHREAQDWIDIKYLIDQIIMLNNEMDELPTIAQSIGDIYPSSNDSRINQLTTWILNIKFTMKWISRIKEDASIVRRRLGVNYRIYYSPYFEEIETRLRQVYQGMEDDIQPYNELLAISIIDLLTLMDDIKDLSDAKKY